MSFAIAHSGILCFHSSLRSAEFNSFMLILRKLDLVTLWIFLFILFICYISLDFEDLFIYLQSTVTRERGRDRETSILVHSPNGPNSQVWARSKLGARNFSPVSHMHGRGPSPWVTFCLPRCISRKLDQKLSSCDSNQLIWDASISSGDLIHCATMPAFTLHILSFWSAV